MYTIALFIDKGDKLQISCLPTNHFTSKTEFLVFELAVIQLMLTAMFKMLETLDNNQRNKYLQRHCVDLYQVLLNISFNLNLKFVPIVCTNMANSSTANPKRKWRCLMMTQTTGRAIYRCKNTSHQILTEVFWGVSRIIRSLDLTHSRWSCKDWTNSELPHLHLYIMTNITPSQVCGMPSYDMHYHRIVIIR